MSNRDVGKIVTECYKFPCLGLKDVVIDMIKNRICVSYDSYVSYIPMTPTSEQGIQVIFEEKNNRPAWDRWGKDVTGIAANLLGGVAGGVASGAVSGAINATVQISKPSSSMGPTSTGTS